MKLSVKRNKKGTSIRFTAESDQDGKDLKTALLASVKNEFTPAGVIDELDKIWTAEAKEKKKEPA